MLPELVRGKLAATGEDGELWLEALPSLITDLEQRWEMAVGDPLDGGSTSFVAPAVRHDGTSAVLKVALPAHEVDDQIDTLDRAAGHGYALLYASDPANRALLMEALGPSLDQIGLSPEEQIDHLCAALQRAWDVPRAPGQTVSPDEEKAFALGRYVDAAWHRLGRPCPDQVITRALSYAERRAAAFDLETAIVVHGDPHPANALRVRSQRPGAESGYVFVDPDGFLSDRGYDLGVVLRDWVGEVRDDPGVLRRFCSRMADRTGVDPAVIWEWGFLERVSTGLYLMDFGAEAQGREFLASAEAILLDH